MREPSATGRQRRRNRVKTPVWGVFKDACDRLEVTCLAAGAFSVGRCSRVCVRVCVP
jgi:hypothetical protein